MTGALQHGSPGDWALRVGRRHLDVRNINVTGHTRTEGSAVQRMEVRRSGHDVILQRIPIASTQVTAFLTVALENARYQRYLRHKVRPKELRGAYVPRAT
nr:hypothetical protein JVH1_3457 [Rhodococcus sp. JVH1]